MDVSASPDDATADVRSEIVLEWLERLDPGADDWESTLSPVAMIVVDALLDADATTLQEIGEPVRDTLAALFHDAAHAREARGYLLAVLAMTRWGLQRLPDPTAVHIDRDTQAWKLLVALDADQRLSSSDLRQRLKTGESQVSRVGRQLLASGLVAQRRAGRTAVWELTPRGRQIVRERGGNSGRHARVR